MNSIKKTCIAAACVALCCVLPGMFHSVGLGTAFSPLLLLAIMFLVTSAVSICGPIGFISLGVPNLSRILCKSTDIRKHYLISSAMGVLLLLVTYLVVKYVSFGIYLPISATMAIIALPLMAILFVRK